MADHTKIEWTDATWNPITGCSRASEGCRHCYAARLAATRLRNHPSREGLAIIDGKGEARFTGQVRLNEQWLADPLRWKRPRMIFVCAHADLFHENVPDEWIDRIFATIILSPQHIFQILTKRSTRMRVWIGRLACAIRDWLQKGDPIPLTTCFPHVAGALAHPQGARTWPLPNVWIGVSAEDQKCWDERVSDLQATPAAVRWVSVEPMLGPIFPRSVCNGAWFFDPLTGKRWHDAPDGKGASDFLANKIDWIVVGGESGNGARPMEARWVRSIRDHCAEAGTSFLFKQWGAYDEHGNMVGKGKAGRELDGAVHDGFPHRRQL